MGKFPTGHAEARPRSKPLCSINFLKLNAIFSSDCFRSVYALEQSLKVLLPSGKYYIHTVSNTKDLGKPYNTNVVKKSTSRVFFEVGDTKCMKGVSQKKLAPRQSSAAPDAAAAVAFG